jgi:hypothetical protein
MSTALPHHQQHFVHAHRSRVIVAGAALLAGLTAGFLFEVSRDDVPTTTERPELPSSLPHHHLHGSGSMEGEWNHAGTTLGRPLHAG